MDHFLANEAKGTKIIGAKSLSDMVARLKTPRKVMLLVKGTATVDVIYNIESITFYTHSPRLRTRIFSCTMGAMDTQRLIRKHPDQAPSPE